MIFVDPRAVLKRHGLKAKRSWGQNFLVSAGAVERIARLCVDQPGRHVVEIGAGLGTLTNALLAVGGRVTAVERDRDLCRVLSSEFEQGDMLTIEEEDAATFDYRSCLDNIPGVIAGNLPYQITGLILRRIMEPNMPLVRAVFMLQLEVATRLKAGIDDRERSALTVMSDARFTSKIVMRLPPTAFHPKPKVRSAVVDLTPREEPLFGNIDPERFDMTVKSAFHNRRKMIRNSLVASGIGSTEVIDAALDAADIDPHVRAEKLPTETFVTLTQALIDTDDHPSEQ